MTARQATPGPGARGDPYLEPGRFDLSLTYRFSDADEHYRGTGHERDRERDGTQVENEQHLFDLRLTTGISERWSASASLPYLAGSWSIPLPLAPAPGPRRRQETEGIGDLVLTPRFWVLDPSENPDGNLQVGLGLKAPTGESNAKDRYPDLSGRYVRRRSADVSIQPGDGGWGAVLDLFAFRDVGDLRHFATGTYLFNPREQNGTLSVASNLLGPGSVAPHLRHNSVPDQYQAQVGVAFPLAGGLSGGLALRWEGVPPRDRFGGNDGFRRPGYFTSLAPGISYTTGNTTFSLSVPRTFVRNRQDDARGDPGDATFADYAILFSVSVGF